MFAQLKKKIEDKENANIPHIVISPNSVSPLRDQPESESEGSAIHETPVRTRKKSEDEKIKTVVSQDETQNSEQSDQSRNSRDAKTIQIADISNHNATEDRQSELVAARKEQDAFLIQQLQKDKLELQSKLQETKAQLDRVIQNKENTEELESFQAQEIAKIKHLLLRSQQELSQKEETIRNRNADLETAGRKLSGLLAEVRRLHQEFDTTTVANLQLEKTALEGEIDRLKQDALRMAKRSSQMEQTLSELTDEHDALSHVHEIYKSKNSSILEVRDQSISQLQERVRVLEKRLDDTALTGDEMTNAVVAERTALEQKLDESHQQLNEIKETWSEKIHSLETQIFHLNKKMAEDSVETSHLDRELEEMKESLRKRQEQSWAMEEQLRIKQEELAQMECAHAELEQNSIARETISQGKVDQLQEHIADLNKEHSREKQDDQAKITQLIAARSERIEKDIELERHVTELEDENRRQKSELSKKGKECVSLGEEIVGLRSKLTELDTLVERLDSEKKAVEKELHSAAKVSEERRKSMHSLTEECDRLMMRNAELSHDLELLRRETAEEGSNRDKEREDSESTNAELQNELQQARNSLAEHEAMIANSGEANSKVAELKTAISNYETELADKNKTIKLQQQRLADMKKALQKELKAQNDSTQVDGRSSAQPSREISLRGYVREDDVNFKYLKHVVFKFMTCSEYEGQHLVRAICALLRFTHEEEQLIKDTLEWKSSWFGVKPQPSRPS